MIVIKLRYITINIQRFENSISTINLYHFLINFFALIIEILKMYCEHFCRTNQVKYIWCEIIVK